MVTSKRATENETQIEKIWSLLKSIWIQFDDISNYILAFVHRSIVNEKPDFTPEHNERLEFLWDAVLELSITDDLFRNYTDKPEGELTDIRSAIVRWRNLAKIARELKLNEYLLLGKWEEKWWWRENDYLLANTVEALIWAIYLDLWFQVAKEFIDKYIYPSVYEIVENKLIKDYKTIIQEISQARFDITPTYIVLQEEWLDHDKKFTVWIYFWEKLMWTWLWTSKKKAQEKAAEDAYLKIQEARKKKVKKKTDI
jgi:ribonuclease III